MLEPGDRIVLASDGIIEAGNESGEIFGFERTAAAIEQGCRPRPGRRRARRPPHRRGPDLCRRSAAGRRYDHRRAADYALTI